MYKRILKKVLNFYRTERNIHCQTLDANEPSIHCLARFYFPLKHEQRYIVTLKLVNSITIKIFIRKIQHD